MAIMCATQSAGIHFNRNGSCLVTHTIGPDA